MQFVPARSLGGNIQSKYRRMGSRSRCYMGSRPNWIHDQKGGVAEMNRKISSVRALLLVGSAIAALPQPVAAQQAGSQPEADAAVVDDTEIIVQARKRSETLIEVPVAITALSASDLSRSAINGTDALARKIPGFLVGEGGGTVQGGSLSLRGISAADANPLGDQAVSFNIDGVQVARASIRRMGDFDIAGVEVLKGPQALFFGKNSPGGIVSTRTADPGDRFEAGGRAGYETEGKEFRGEGYISAPLTESLGARLAFFGSTMKGWVKNLVPKSDPFAPNSSTSPNKDEWAMRTTLKFDDGGAFRAKLKVSYNHVRDNGMTNNYQTVDCPYGVEFANGPISDCKADNHITQASLGPAFGRIVAGGAVPPAPPGLPYSDFGDGSLRSISKQWLAGFEANYDIAPDLELTSVTGYYRLNFFNVGNFTATYLPAAILGSMNELHIREFSEEIRLASSFSGPINFLVGGQYQTTKADTASIAAFGAVAGAPSILGPTRPSPFLASDYFLDQKGKAYSVFGQIQLKPIEQIEISAGGRYSHEEKRLKSVINRGVELVGNQPFLSNGNNDKSWNNFSPEISISYRPNRDLNVYTTYKHGFLSGGFNGGSFNAAGDFAYRPQKVKGFEGGVKGRFLDGLVTADLALYSYKITDLQVQVTTQGTVQELKNAGKVSSKGVELAVNVRPTTALSLYANVAYNDGKYDQYFGSCYTGQAVLSPGTGIGQCASQPNPTNNNIVGLLQNLSGTELIRAPKWSGNAGFTYETPLTGDSKIELASGLTFSNSYVANATSKPGSRSPSFTMIDASVRVAQSEDKWEVALIGRNLTNEFYWTRSTDNPTGSANPTKLADTTAVPGRGREMWIRVGFKY